MKKRRKWPFVVGAFVLLVVGLGVAFFMNVPAPLEVSSSGIDISTIPDGRYTGSCDNKLVKAEVAVTVRDGAIADVEILAHDNGLGSKGEGVVDGIIAQNRPDVDAVAGATYSSQTIQKAVENALRGAMQ